jgi:oxygen-independent coproporphyrinogen-3 oxidase
LQILKETIEELVKAGYVFIGMDHFAKPNDEMALALRDKKLYRNFQGYSTNAGTDLYGFGITSISQIGRVYAQNYKKEKEYFDSLNNEKLPVQKGVYLSDDDLLRREVIMRVMCDFSLDFRSIEAQFNINFNEYFANSLINLGGMEQDGLLSIGTNYLEVSNKGRLLIRNIAMRFDGFIERKEDQGRYSRTV